MSTNDEILNLDREEVIDQRTSPLPPIWIAQKPGMGTRQELTIAGVHQSGRNGDALRRFCESIATAREVVVVSSFLLAEMTLETALFKASQRGVRVYLLLASETRLGRENLQEDDFGTRCLEDHKRMLNQLAGWALIRSAAHFHAKSLLVDPHLNGRGFLSTANLTTDALRRNEEIIVELTAAEARHVFEILRWAMWESPEHEMLESSRFEAVKPLKKLSKPAANQEIRAVMDDTDTITDAVLQVIREATSEVLVASFGWQADHPAVKALCERASKGLRVTVLARPRAAAMPALLALRLSGARVLGFDWLHAKAIWNDAGHGMVITSNLEPLHAGRNFELGLQLRGERASALAAHLNSWITSAPWVLEASLKLGDVIGETMIWTDKKLEKALIKSSQIHDLGEFIAESVELMESTKALLPKLSLIKHTAHEVCFCYRVVAPKLAAKSRERMKPASKGIAPQRHTPPVFKEPGGRVVVAIRATSELPLALQTKQGTRAEAIVLLEECLK